MDGLQVAHLTDQQDIRVLAQGGPQGGGETLGVDSHFALADQAAFAGVLVFDGVFDGDDVAFSRIIRCGPPWPPGWWISPILSVPSPG